MNFTFWHAFAAFENLTYQSSDGKLLRVHENLYIQNQKSRTVKLRLSIGDLAALFENLQLHYKESDCVVSIQMMSLSRGRDSQDRGRTQFVNWILLKVQYRPPARF
jgi:hypothetical protein